MRVSVVGERTTVRMRGQMKAKISNMVQDAMIGTVGALYLRLITSYILCLLYAGNVPRLSSADFSRRYLL
jgi:hypothetical protein